MRHGHLRNVGVAHEKACRDICSRTPLFETIFDIGCESLIGDELVDLKWLFSFPGGVAALP